MKKKNVIQRTIIIVIVTIVGIYLVIGPRGRRPRLNDFTWSGVKANLKNNIRLGLDLKGGSHLVMRVRVDKYLAKLTEDNSAAARKAAEDAGFQIKDARAETAGEFRFVLEAPDATKLNDIQNAVKAKVDVTDWSAAVSGSTISWTNRQPNQRSESLKGV
jgi:preprotein translocase subunit SecD